MEKDKGLKDRHRIFAQKVAGGMAAGRAYEAAGYSVRGEVADAAASRLLANVKVAAYLAELREEIRENSVMECAELELFLTKAIRTPLRKVTPDSPLCVEWTRDEIMVKERCELNQEELELTGLPPRVPISRVRVKKVNPLEAGKLLAALKGWNKPVEVNHKVSIADIVAGIDATPGPTP